MDSWLDLSSPSPFSYSILLLLAFVIVIAAFISSSFLYTYEMNLNLKLVGTDDHKDGARKLKKIECLRKWRLLMKERR